jgi:hypothetical protein
MKKDIIHQYFKKTFSNCTIIVQIDPERLRGVELTIHKNGALEKRKLDFDQEIFNDLEHDQFTPSSPLEFNLYLKGLIK